MCFPLSWLQAGHADCETVNQRVDLGPVFASNVFSKGHHPYMDHNKTNCNGTLCHSQCNDRKLF